MLTNGIAGMSDGRAEVRNKLIEVAAHAEEAGHESVIACSTINHPDTELAYPYGESFTGMRMQKMLSSVHTTIRKHKELKGSVKNKNHCNTTIFWPIVN